MFLHLAWFASFPVNMLHFHYLPIIDAGVLCRFFPTVQVELIRRDYAANGGHETFLSYEDPKQDILIGLLRLRKCSSITFRQELKGNCSIVRELHVYPRTQYDGTLSQPISC